MGRDCGWKPQRRDGGGLALARDFPRPSLAHGERRGAGGCRLCGLADDARLAVAGDRRAAFRRADLGADRLAAAGRIRSGSGCCARRRSTRSPPSGASRYLPDRSPRRRRRDPGPRPPRPRRQAPAGSSGAGRMGSDRRAARSIRSRRSPPPRSPRPAPSTKRSPISARRSRQWRWRRRTCSND